MIFRDDVGRVGLVCDCSQRQELQGDILCSAPVAGEMGYRVDWGGGFVSPGVGCYSILCQVHVSSCTI